MKNIRSFLILFSSIALLSVALVYAFETPVASTVYGVTAAMVGFKALTFFNIITIPSGALGVYIGAPGVETENGSAGVQVLSTGRSRAAYMTYRTDRNYEGKDITPSFLRLEAVIANGNNKLTFKTYVGDGTSQTPTEKRLERNDKFAIIRLGFFLMAVPAGKSTGRLHSYPNITDFGAAAAGDLEALYNGELGMTIQRKKTLVSYDMQRFLKVPETQQSSATNRDKFSLDQMMVNLTPHIDLDGNGTNEIEIVYPSHSTFAGGTPLAGFTNVAVLYAQGFLINNGSANI